jgi:hypothetical protein
MPPNPSHLFAVPRVKMAFKRNDELSGLQIRQRMSRLLRRAVPNRNRSSPPEGLPVPRPRPITPPDSAACHPQQHSPFFSLPPEIRREILLIAFGNSTMHIDLVYDRPMLGHATTNFGGEIAHCGFTSQRDMSAPKQWTWRSCMCHRNLLSLGRDPFSWRWEWLRPELDQCLLGNAYTCSSPTWPGEWPLRCRVGVVGWLLSCRKA